MTLTDDRLAAVLEEMAGRPDAGSLVTDVLRAIDGSPQRRASWLPWPSGQGIPAPVLIALLLLAIAMAGTLAVGSGLIRIPWFVTVPPTPTIDDAGGIAIRGEGCTILLDTTENDPQIVLTEGFPNCYPTSNSFELDWSPDGHQLAMAYTFFCGACVSPEAHAAIDNQITGLWLMDVETDTYHQLVACDLGCSSQEPRWSPDGSHIAYISAAFAQLWSVPAAGGPAQQIGSENHEAVIDFAWSPDSTRLALVRTSSGPSFVSIIGADGSNETTVWQTPGSVESVDWAPDGHTLVIAADDTVALIFLIDDGGSIRATNGSPLVLVTEHDNLISHVSFSPDGSKIAWVAAREAQVSETDTSLTQVRYSTMDADGKDQTLVFESQDAIAAASRPTWSPDGAYLTFGIVDMQGQRLSYVTASDGSIRPLLLDSSPLTEATSVTAPAWRPVAAP
jgi:Tol biopolymer transport system component